jgi:hypothetical protein
MRGQENELNLVQGDHFYPYLLPMNAFGDVFNGHPPLCDRRCHLIESTIA